MTDQRPDLSTESGRLSFIKILNKRLPTKRNIAQGIVRNEQGEILLCQLTYKKEWDLPGGVVDPHESPAACVVREISEELGLDLTVRGLLAVNWLPPWRGWDDAVLFLFDLGTVPQHAIDASKFLRREIMGAHWRSTTDAAAHIAPYTARMLAVIDGLDHPAYLENSDLPGGGS